MIAPHLRALADSLRDLQANDDIRVAAGRLANAAGPVRNDLQREVLAQVPAFSTTRNPDLLPELKRHLDEHVDEILRLVRGGSPGEPAFVRVHARRRAEQRFPLDATLHAYRCIRQVLLQWLRDGMQSGLQTSRAQRAVAQISEFIVEYADAVSMIFATEYSSHALLLASVAGDQRLQLLQILVDGYDEADTRAARILREAGFLADRQAYCVALGRSVDPAEMLHPARARRLAEAMEQAVGPLGMKRVIDVRDNRVILVAAAMRRESGWTAPSTSIASRLADALALLGNAVVVGIGNDAPSTSHIPGSLREAATALEMADVRERVVRFSALPLQTLLLHFAGDDFRRVLPAWSSPLFAADTAANGALRATLHAYAAADMNILKAALALGVHANTIYARLQRIRDITGLDARTFGDLSSLLLVTGCGPARP